MVASLLGLSLTLHGTHRANMRRVPMRAVSLALSRSAAQGGMAFARTVRAGAALGARSAVASAPRVGHVTRSLHAACGRGVAVFRGSHPSLVAGARVPRPCSLGRRGVATFTRPVRCEPQHPKAGNPHSRHYTGPGSEKAWRKAQAKAAVRRRAPTGSRGKLLVFAFAAGTAASVGVMIYNVFLWTRARGVETQSLKDAPLIEGNPLVFFDLEADGRSIGRVVRVRGRRAAVRAWLVCRLTAPALTCLPRPPCHARTGDPTPR